MRRAVSRPLHQGQKALLENHAKRVGLASHHRRHLVDLIDADGCSIHRLGEVFFRSLATEEAPSPLLHGREQSIGAELEAVRVDQQVRVDDRHRAKLPVFGDVVVEALNVVHRRGLAGTRIADQQDVARYLAGDVLENRDRDQAQGVILPQDTTTKLFEDQPWENGLQGAKWVLGF